MTAHTSLPQPFSNVTGSKPMDLLAKSSPCPNLRERLCDAGSISGAIDVHEGLRAKPFVNTHPHTTPLHHILAFMKGWGSQREKRKDTIAPRKSPPKKTYK